MKILTNQRTLLEGVTILNKIVKSKNPESILSNVCIIAQSNNRVKLITTNLKTNIIITIPSDIIELGSITTNIAELTKIVKNCDSGVLNISYHDNKLFISPDNTELYTMKTLSSENFPKFETITDNNYFMAADILQDMLKDNLPSVSDDETRYFLNGVYFEKMENCLNLVSTDGRRLTFNTVQHYTAFKNDNIVATEGLKIFSHLKNIDSVMKVSNNNKLHSLQCTYKHMGITFEIEIQNSIIQGQFPQYRRILNVEEDRRIILDVKDLKKSIPKLSTFYKSSRCPKIEASFKNNKFSFLTCEDEANLTLEICKHNYNNFDSVFINPDHIEDILKTAKGEIIIYFNEPNKPIKIMQEFGFTISMTLQE